MANRKFSEAWTQARKHVFIDFAFLPQGAGAPIMGEGDPNSSYVTLTRTGVGAYQIVMKDPFVAWVGGAISFILNAPAGQWNGVFGAPSVTTKGIFTLIFTLFSGAAATDIAANANNRVYVELEFRNSGLKP